VKVDGRTRCGCVFNLSGGRINEEVRSLFSVQGRNLILFRTGFKRLRKELKRLMLSMHGWDFQTRSISGGGARHPEERRVILSVRIVTENTAQFCVTYQPLSDRDVSLV
jgi:hypothetical protein